MKQMSRRVLALVLMISLLFPSLASIAQAQESKEADITRLSGKGRVETSVAVSKVVYKTSEAVVLAGYNGQADALTGALFAKSKEAPLLLVNEASLDIVKAEIDRLGVKDIYILGGGAAVEKSVEDALKAEGYNVERVYGANRDATALEVAKEAKIDSKHVFLANGGNKNLVDALAAGPASAKENMPILLTQKDQVSDDLLKALEEMKVAEITLVGGTGAISDAVKAQLEAKKIKVNRVSGSGREETAIAVAKKYFPKSKTTLIANGYNNLADAIVGGYFGATINAPILLSNKTQATRDTEKFIETMDKLYILGGAGVIKKGLFGKESKLIDPEETVIMVKSITAVNGKVTVTLSEDVIELPEGLVFTIDGEELSLSEENTKLVDEKIEIKVPTVQSSTEGITEVKYTVRLNGVTKDTKLVVPAVISPIEMRTVEAVEELEDIKVEFDGEYNLPGTVKVTLSDKEIIQVPVEWDNTKVDVKNPGSYNIQGKLDFSKVMNLKDQETEQMVTIKINVMEKVLTKADLQDLIESIKYVDVSKDGLDIDYDKEWTTQEARNKLEDAVIKVEDMLEGEEFEYVVKKGEKLNLSTSTFYREIDGTWIVEDPSILSIESTGSSSISFGPSIQIKYTVEVLGLKQGYTQLKFIDETRKMVSSTIVRVIDESVPEFTQDELSLAMTELTEAIDHYNNAKEPGKKLSPDEMLQAAKEAVTKAEENKVKSDIYAAKRLVDLLPITKDKEILEHRLENLMLEVAVPVTLLAYTGTSKEVEIPKFIDSEKIINDRYGDFEIEGSLGEEDIAVIEKIEGYAFYDLGLTGVVIPDTVKEVGAYSFGDNNLTQLNIPSSLSYIAPYSFLNAFSWSTEGHQLVVPETVKEIGESAFSLNSLKKLDLPEGLEKIGKKAFWSNDLKSIQIPSSISEIEEGVFGANKLESVIIPKTVIRIGESAFSNNELEFVDLPDSIREIGVFAFSFNNLREIDIPTGISILENSVFANNRLRTVTIPENIKEIKYYAFDRNILTKIILPNNVKIGREILGANNQLRDEYEKNGKSAGVYIGTQYGEWTKESK